MCLTPPLPPLCLAVAAATSLLPNASSLASPCDGNEKRFANSREKLKAAEHN